MSEGHEQHVPWRALAPVAGIGGLAATASFMPFNAWPLAFVAVALLAWSTARARGVLAAVGLGWAFGAVFMFTSLVWQTSIMVASYAGLSLVMSLFYAALGGALHLVARLRWAPVWGAGAWALMEFVTSVFPFDGFAWMRLGYTQLDSWLAGFYPLAGAASVTYLVALLGHLLADLVATRTPRAAVALGAALLVTVGVGLAGRAWLPADSGAAEEVQVGWVQPGAPGGGVYGLGEARTITFNTQAETGRLMERVRAGDEVAPDLIVWPENSTDMDPRQDAPTAAAVDAAVADAGVPVVVGTIYTDEAAQTRQTVAVRHDAAGAELVYAKRNLVPFGEWIPFRDFFLPLIPQLAYVGHQSVPGTTPGAFPVTLADGRTVEVGVAICYEVIYPETVFEAARDAQVMVVQSSNAMYQGTIQIDQQFAATRVRAAEMRREVLVVTTTGVSGLVGQRGEVLDLVPDSVSASGVHAMALRTTATPAMVASRWVEYLLAAQGLAGVAWGLWVLGSRRRGGTMDVGSAAPVPVRS